MLYKEIEEMTENEIVLKLAEQALKANESDVVGDLIKIGFPIIGTIIGGLIGFFASKLTAQVNSKTQIELASLQRITELEKELMIKRNLRLEELISCLDDFIQNVMDYCTHVKNWKIHHKNNNRDKLTETEQKLKESESKFYQGFLPLLSAESKLLVLGADELQNELRSLGEYTQEMYRSVHKGNSEITSEEIDNKLNTLKEKRKGLYKSIGEHEVTEHNKLLQRTHNVSR